MSDDQAKQRSEVDAELEREIRQGESSLHSEAMGRIHWSRHDERRFRRP